MNCHWNYFIVTSILAVGPKEEKLKLILEEKKNIIAVFPDYFSGLVKNKSTVITLPTNRIKWKQLIYTRHIQIIYDNRTLF